MTQSNAESRLWWQWIAATTFGWFLFMALSRSALFWVGMVVIGTGQWFVLRKHLKRAGWWLLATPLGLLLGAAMGGVLGGLVQDTIDGISSIGFGIRSVVPGRGVGAYLVAEALGSLCLGVVLGASQWLVLRVGANRAALWLAASSMSIAVGFTLNDLVGGSALNDVVPLVILVQVFGASLISVITGLALLRCLRNSQLMRLADAGAT